MTDFKRKIDRFPENNITYARFRITCAMNIDKQ